MASVTESKPFDPTLSSARPSSRCLPNNPAYRCCHECTTTSLGLRRVRRATRSTGSRSANSTRNSRSPSVVDPLRVNVKAEHLSRVILAVKMDTTPSEEFLHGEAVCSHFHRFDFHHFRQSSTNVLSVSERESALTVTVPVSNEEDGTNRLSLYQVTSIRMSLKPEDVCVGDSIASGFVAHADIPERVRHVQRLGETQGSWTPGATLSETSGAGA